ncbi:hypothetical protein QYF36_025169 [Acer negundo]|nr:hypothetical protein QYF36_025169 [Acer negundo]
MTTLEVCGCKLEQPSGPAGFHFLKNVKLVKVLLNEQIVQMLITECPLLENLLLHYCSGLKRFCVSDALKLRVVEFFTSYDEVESANSLDEEFDSIVSKYSRICLSRCNFLEKVIISSIQLKKLQFVNCSSLKDIDIDTPNLVSFYYEGNSVPKSSINAPCSWDIRFENEGALNTRWFLYVKDFLGVNQIEDLFITLKSEKGDEEPYDIDDLNKLPELPLGDLYLRLDWRCNEA